MTIRERAAEIVDMWCIQRGVSLKYRPVARSELIDAIVKLATPDKDHVRDDKGVDHPDTFYRTVDGVPIGHGTKLYYKDGGIQEGRAVTEFRDDWGYEIGLTPEKEAYSTREAALAAHPNEKGSAHGE